MSIRMVVWGASGHALNVIDMLRLDGRFDIAGLIDDVHPERAGSVFDGLQILGGREQLVHLLNDGVDHIVLAFGNNAARLSLGQRVIAQGFHLVTVIHPSATVARSVTIGTGTVVGAGVVVSPMASIGDSVIVNTLASVGHECVVEDGVSVGPGVRIGGGTRIGRGSQIGIGAALRDHICIGARSVIGAGAVVLKDIPPGVMVYGVPARVIREVDDDANL